jgi:hypothetical protein
VYAASGNPVTFRGFAEILSWFADLRLVHPGVVPLPLWRPDVEAAQGEFSDVPAYGGIGLVTG